MTNTNNNAVSILTTFLKSGEFKSDYKNIANFLVAEESKFSPSFVANMQKTLNSLITPEQAGRMKDQKVAKRLLRMNAVITGALVDSSINAATLQLIEANASIGAVFALACTSSKELTQQQVHFIAGIMREGRDVRPVDGVKKSTINKFLGLGGTSGTVSAQVSTLCKEKGIFSILGFNTVVGKGRFIFNLAKRDSCAFLQAYVKALDLLTDSQFSQIQAKIEA